VTTYYLRTADDQAHLSNPGLPGQARCGVILRDARPVSALQVLVYLDDKRCGRCDPVLSARGNGGRAAARRHLDKDGAES
jgi:hypothetical protein